MPGFTEQMGKNRRSKKKHRGAPVSPAKAGEILRHGEVRGHKLTKKQRGFFGLIRGGGTPRS